MKVKDLLKNIDSWFDNSVYCCEFVTDVKESYNEQSNNLKYCYISDVTVNDANKIVDIKLERDFDNTIFMYHQLSAREPWLTVKQKENNLKVLIENMSQIRKIILKNTNIKTR